MKNKILIAVVVFLMLFMTLCSCTNDTDSGKMSVVCAGFAEYDWTRNIIGEASDKFELVYLLDDGSDPHSFQPSIIDMATITDADLFIYVGGESNQWAKEIIAGASSSSFKTLSIYELFKDELIESSVSSNQEDHEHSQDHHHGGYDEHLWLSLKNAVKSVEAIRDALCMVDPEGRDIYAANCEIYIEKILKLDAEYNKAVSGSSNTALVFADRFPFSYLARDYSINYYAAYSGCSADSELSQERLVYLAEKMDELRSEYICVIETSDGRLAKTVAAETQKGRAEVLVFNSCQSVTSSQIKDGTTYLGVMESNLELIKKALG